MYKRILSAVCALAVTFTMAISLPSVSVDTSGFVISASAAGEYEEAAVEFHDHLKNLDRSFTVSVIMDKKPDDPNKFVDELFYEATRHTGDPTDGDRIHLHVYSMTCSYSTSRMSSGSVKITLKFDMVYNTTAEQAVLADEKADRIIEYLDLDGKTDLEKITEIYNYICQNVEYDLERQTNQAQQKTALPRQTNPAQQKTALPRQISLPGKITAHQRPGIQATPMLRATGISAMLTVTER